MTRGRNRMSLWPVAETSRRLETFAAVDLLATHVPELKVRVINVVNLMTLQPS